MYKFIRNALKTGRRGKNKENSQVRILLVQAKRQAAYYIDG